MLVYNIKLVASARQPVNVNRPRLGQKGADMIFHDAIVASDKEVERHFGKKTVRT